MTELEKLLTACETSGGAVAPHAVVKLCAVIRAYAGVCAEMGDVILEGGYTDGWLDGVSDRLESIRRLTLT